MPGEEIPINEFVLPLEPSRTDVRNYVQPSVHRNAPCIQFGPLFERYDMLILTRRVGQRVFIGPHVTLTVVAINGTQVRFEISAPEHISVNRAEVHARRALQKEEAVK